MSLRKMQRQILRNKGKLPMKKVVAKKLGISVKELNRRIKAKERGNNEQ